MSADKHAAEPQSLNFLEEIVEKDLASGKYQSIMTRFPPEPNGYLHIGHASSICLNFGLTEKFGGATNLRFDDTNPVTEDTAYVDSIKEDIAWLGFNWANEFYASDYFDTLYELAVGLIQKGLAYVDDSDSETIAAEKGSPTQPGRRNVFAERSIEENLRLFAEMRDGKYQDGEKVLRAKIDMQSPNMLMRDPILYRIKHAPHHRTGNQWPIYPMYDFAHGQSDALEQITHSICTMEFVPHREVYDWLIRQMELFPSHQYEFARRNLSHTVTSKRKLLELVTGGYVKGWDDPRMPTIAGYRRRGYTPASIREFCRRIGVGKRDNMVDMGLLEFCAREDLNRIALRRMVVFDPIKVVLTNYEKQEELLPAENNPEDAGAGERLLRFGRELYIEREDFMENPPRKYFRLAPGSMVRLKHAYIIQCDEVIKDENGQIQQLNCSYFPDSKSGADSSGIRVKGTLHWVNAADHLPVEIHEYDRLFTVEDPTADDAVDFKTYLNPDALRVVTGALAEPALAGATTAEHFQFLRKGYFILDRQSPRSPLIFNRTVTLKDGWAKKSQ